ncbi:hypothetical protein PH586_17885 [Pseudomonas sp. SA3-5]|uniref:Uncharacterized protein n=1 Tax=Pseudomonas aestuarii TaxID=3018340 RepID=A0ABT4XJ77_9PSED|nr:hypothetical protein [Pseudomonas aestuarii]MDA7088259.1 hypothetical protein [Pseudomonas aestuarii]
MTTVEHKVKTCKHCLQPFEFKRKTADFCAESCKKKHKAIRQRKLQKKRLYRAETSAFFYYLADECRRAETIEILRDHTLESITELHTVYKYRMKANGFGSEATYSLCHLFPVKHPFQIGVLRAENLVVSYSNLNSKHSNTAAAGIGVSIPRHTLSPKWKISENATKTAVISKIVEYWGQPLVEQLAVKLKLQPTVRQQVFDFLISSTDPRVPTQSKLEAMSTQELSTLKALITGKETSGFGAYAELQEYGQVFGHELRRLSNYREELLTTCKAWEACLEDYIRLELSLHYGKLHKKTKSKLAVVLQAIYAEQFNLLHGGNAQGFNQRFSVLVIEGCAIQGEKLSYEDTLSDKDRADWEEQKRRAKGRSAVVDTPPARAEFTPSTPVTTTDWVAELDNEYEAILRVPVRYDTPPTTTYFDPPPF